MRATLIASSPRRASIARRIVLGLALLSGCGHAQSAAREPVCPPPPLSKMVPSDDLKALTQKLYEAMGSGKPEEVETLYTLGEQVAFMGTAANEFWTDSVVHNADVRPRLSKGGLKLTSAELVAYEQGNLGWVVDRPEVRMPNGFAFKMRVTLLWRKEAGNWKIYHSHASVAAR